MSYSRRSMSDYFYMRRNIFFNLIYKNQSQIITADIYVSIFLTVERLNFQQYILYDSRHGMLSIAVQCMLYILNFHYGLISMQFSDNHFGIVFHTKFSVSRSSNFRIIQHSILDYLMIKMRFFNN